MSKATIYHFWSPTCAPCKAIKPMIEDLKEEFAENTVWISVDTHNDVGNLAGKFGVRVVPTIVAVGANGMTESHSGTAAAGYYRIIRTAIRNS
jgi:thioredoxin 1